MGSARTGRRTRATRARLVGAAAAGTMLGVLAAVAAQAAPGAAGEQATAAPTHRTTSHAARSATGSHPSGRTPRSHGAGTHRSAHPGPTGTTAPPHRTADRADRPSSDPADGASTGPHGPSTDGTTRRAGPTAEPTGDVPPGTGPLRPVPALQRECRRPAIGVVTHAPDAARKTVALTFDDGPDAATPQVLDVLARAHVHATFFVLGRQAAAHPSLVRRAAAEGHLVGDHTWDHVYPRQLRQGWTAAYLADQIGRTAERVEHLTGAPVCWFRPPGGEQPGTVRPAAHRMRMTVAVWSVDTRDWEVQGVDGRHPHTDAQVDAQARTIYRRAVAGGSQRHPVVLMHDGGGYRGATARALPRVIAWYRAHGYTFVRIDGTS